MALVAISEALSLRYIALAILILLPTAIIIDYARVLLLRRKLPPGPLPWPIVGNTFQLPPNKPWIYFEEISKRLNAPVITYWIGRNPTVWINDAWSASDILDKRAGIYASRPRMVVFGELSMGKQLPANVDQTRVHRFCETRPLPCLTELQYALTSFGFLVPIQVY